jgi:uncharacterized BrkB/YihY/UPF0761 family membrane protein
MRIHLVILFAMNVATLVFAWVNNTEEELPDTAFFLETIAGAIASGIIAVAVFWAVSRFRKRIDYIFGFVAYMISLLGMIAYAIYASNGKADSLYYAAHMHVIVFPMLLGFVTLVALIGASIISFTIYLLFQHPKRTEQTDAANSRASGTSGTSDAGASAPPEAGGNS